MKKLIKWLAIAVAGLVVIVILAALILPSVIDPNEHKPRIEAELTKVLGRQVTLAGPLSLSVFPWVAVEAADVSVANETGFTADHLLSVETAAARVKLIPLISGKIEVGTVILKEPRVNLEINEAGVSNWQSLMSADSKPEPSDSSPSGQPADLDVKIAGIEVVDAAVSYNDRSSDFAAAIEKFNLKTGAIDSNGPLTLDLSMALVVDDLVNATIAAQAEGRGLLNSSAPVITVSKLDVEGRYLAAGQGGMPLSVSLDQPLSLDQGSGQLEASGLVIRAGDLRVLVDVKGQMEGTLAGSLKIPEFNLREWLADDMGMAMAFADNTALTAVSVDSAFSMTGSQASLNQLAIGLDDTSINGSARLTDFAGPNGTFQMAIDAIDVDRYLPAGGDDDAPDEASAPLTLDDLAIGRLDGALTIGELKVAGVTATDVTLKMKTSPEGITLEPMQAKLYDGLLNTQVKLSPGTGSGRLSLNQTIDSVQAGPLLQDLLGTQYMTGTGKLEAKLDIDDALGATPLAGANGRVSFVFDDGAIFGMDVVGSLQKAASLLGSGSSANEAAGDEDEQPATRFSRMEMVAVITNGVLKTQTLALESPLLNMGGQVTINLVDMSLSGLVEPTIVDPAGLGALERFAGVAIPVRLSGTLDAPGVSVDPAKLALASQKGKIDKKKDELLGRLLGGDDDQDDAEGDGEDEDEDDSKKKLLKSLFGSDDDGGQ